MVLNIPANITPNNCPPKIRMPPDVPSPMGKDVSTAKSMRVVRRGYVQSPEKPPTI